MDTMGMITKALEAVVEQKVAEKATTVNLESIGKWVETSSLGVLGTSPAG